MVEDAGSASPAATLDWSAALPTPRRITRFWPVFSRIHLRALWQDRWRTALAAIGIGIGVTVVVANVVLQSEFAKPFAAFGPSLTAAADPFYSRNELICDTEWVSSIAAEVAMWAGARYQGWF